jgi:ElaB/YqjD/DUF883 family membrane-anchored ribosome-binding protein
MAAAKIGATKPIEEESEDESAGMSARFNRQVEEARRRVTEGMGAAKEKLGDYQAQAADAWEDTLDYIRENPGKVIAFSFGVGLAVGAFLRLRQQQNLIEEEAE